MATLTKRTADSSWKKVSDTLMFLPKPYTSYRPAFIRTLLKGPIVMAIYDFMGIENRSVQMDDCRFVTFPYQDSTGKSYASKYDFFRDCQLNKDVSTHPVLLYLPLYLLGYNPIITTDEGVEAPFKVRPHPFPLQDVTIHYKRSSDGRDVWSLPGVELEIDENVDSAWMVLTHLVLRDFPSRMPALESKEAPPVAGSSRISADKEWVVPTLLPTPSASVLASLPASVPVPLPVPTVLPTVSASVEPTFVEELTQPILKDTCSEESIRDLWSALIVFLEKNNVNFDQPDSAKLHRLIRQFSVNILALHPRENSIMIGSKVLMQFPAMIRSDFGDRVNYQDKQSFLAGQKKSSEWGDEALLHFIFYHLGYQATVTVKTLHEELPAYFPFNQPFPIGVSDFFQLDTMAQANQHVRGFHWELLDKPNPADGHCMFHMMGNQIMRDIKTIKRKLAAGESITIKKDLVLENELKHQNFTQLQTLYLEMRQCGIIGDLLISSSVLVDGNNLAEILLQIALTPNSGFDLKGWEPSDREAAHKLLIGMLNEACEKDPKTKEFLRAHFKLLPLVPASSSLAKPQPR